MSPHAQFVHRDSEGNGTSSFDRYIQLIALLYLAATDPSIPSIEGHTPASRFQHFVRELAMINRAHNWDSSRLRADGKDTEEYDDLQGDKPSCHGGVKRRLFQSVLGHPLLTVLTKDTIQYEIHSFIRDHYLNYFANHPEKKTIISQIVEQYIMELTITEDGSIELQSLEISEGQVKEFTDSLVTKYGRDNMEVAFFTQIDNYFRLNANDPPSQILKFVGPIGWGIFD
jgi:hypothetical protein